MVTLISRWKLRNGAPPELVDELRQLAEKVRDSEPGTLTYTIHLTHDVAPDEQTEVVFFEVYEDEAAFHTHLAGPVFAEFVSCNIKYFYEQPKPPGTPNAETIFLERQSGFCRPPAP